MRFRDRKWTPGLLGCVLILIGVWSPVGAQKFYPDDPLVEEPPPFPAVAPQFRALNEIVDLLENTFLVVGERHPADGVIPAQGVNTLGEVMKGPWYENRLHPGSVSAGELARLLPRQAPSFDAPWRVLTVKGFGARPGILVRDARRRMYLLRFDPPGYPEMATGASMVASQFFHALGYHVPENYIVHFPRSQLVPHRGGTGITSLAEHRELTDLDIDAFLQKVAAHPERGYRALATRIPDNWKRLLGPFEFHGVRSDDPNDVVSHEHRRDLRGLFVFAAWLNFADVQATKTMDVLVEQGGTPQIRHYWMDLETTLGSGGRAPKRAEAGYEPLLDGRQALRNALGAGIYVPDWMRVRYPGLPSVSNFSSGTFRPSKWSPSHSLAPFENRLPDDEFWAARKCMAFSEEAIRALVKAGQYSDPEAEDWLVESLLERRNQIGRTYLSKVLPLDRFEVRDGELIFQDLAVEYGFMAPRRYSVRWSEFDNERMQHNPIGQTEHSSRLPAETANAPAGSYFSAEISAGEEGKSVTTFLRKGPNGFRVVGVEWSWPGKKVVPPKNQLEPVYHRYADLHPVQKRLLERFAEGINRREGYRLSGEELFDSLTVSERTTFDSVTHALINTELSDETGASLGRAIDLVEGLERIAGQDASRRRDQQFRLYCRLAPGAVQKLEGAREFFRDQENSSYHKGYPVCFRQGGNLPSLQFSVSEDGNHADIDIDYRSSGWPNALFNGHFKTANSDVRAGGNARRHNRRWAGLIEWWQGEISAPAASETSLASGSPPSSPGTPAPVPSSPAQPDRRRR